MFMIFLLLMATAALQVRNPPSKIQSQSKHSADIPPKSVRKISNLDGILEKHFHVFIPFCFGSFLKEFTNIN